MKNVAVTLLILAALLMVPTNLRTVTAETDPALPQALGRLEGTGTHFELTSSNYLNITLDSSEAINLVLESVPEMVTLHLESASGASTAQITLGGFLPSTTYHQYEDDYHNHATFTTDSSGRYTYSQDLSNPHFVFIQSNPSTKFINDNSTGGDCTLIGTWDSATKTCTLTVDVYETIQIDSNGITLDGNGRTITGTGPGYGVYLNRRNGVTIKNLNVQTFTYGISLIFSNGNTLTNNRATIFLQFSTDNTLDANTASSGYDGIHFVASYRNKLTNSTISSNTANGVSLYLSDYNTLTNNNISSNGYGISTSLSDGTIITRNTVRSSGYSGISFYYSSAQVYNNNFINNPVQAVDNYGGHHVLNVAAPAGGNYWSDYDTSAEGCNNVDGDSFCDAPYIFTGGQDDLPWTRQDGWLNQPPTANAGGPYNVPEGSSVTLNGSGSDPDGAPLTYTWDLDNNGTFETGGQNPTFIAIDGPSSQTVVLQVCDNQNACASSSAEVSVTNVAPEVGVIGAPSTPVALNTTITANTTFTDAGKLDTHTAVWNWGDGSTSAGTVSETNGSGSVSGSHAYATAGVYPLTLTVTDKDGASSNSSFQYVVVYDPSGGFVTGGGLIESPIGAYVPNPSLVGKANFGFVAKYQQGATAPIGNTQFRFQMADLGFRSTSYERLVVSGARGQFMGSGTINGSGDYGFLLTAIDGQENGGGGVDKFRIKIWDKATGNVIYDNQVGAADTSDTADPVTAIAAGSIVVHK